jgi:hypothetical protein
MNAFWAVPLVFILGRFYCIHLVVSDYMSNFEHFSICNKGEKKIFFVKYQDFWLTLYLTNRTFYVNRQRIIQK